MALGLVGGCSSESSSDSNSPASQQSASQKADRPLSDYLLQASDVPAGYTQMNIPADQASQAADSLLASTKGSKVSPATCQPDLSGVSADSLKNATANYFAAGTSGGLIGSTVVADTDYVAKYRKYNLGSCATHKVTSSVNGQSFTGSVTTKEIDVATPGVEGALVVQQDVTTNLPGTAPLKQSSYLAVLPADGATVSVTQKNILGTTAPDRGAFTKAVAAAA
ncbi:hypothetical protein, partial [Williamsia sp.]|uniref:hypothetical protein n=1 Tax=Williamsia sp. TaxID=1872085 RepID=UPI001A28931C